MSDQRSVMKEFRFLDQKRQTSGLSAEEATRYAQLRDLVGPDTAAPPRAGFDVNAAAVRLRESLLPGGLRGQVPAADLRPEPLPEPEVAVAPEGDSLEAAWQAQPFAPLGVEPAPAADPLFDPASMGHEVRPQAWNPEAPGYDPSAPYDEAAWIAAGYDPNATYDWSAYYPDGQAPQPEEATLPGEAAAPAAPVDEAEAVAFADVAAGAGPGSVAAAWQEAPVAAEDLPFDPNAPFDHAKWFGRSAPEAVEAEPTGMPELEPLDELTPEPIPEPGPAPSLSEAEAAWAAAQEAQPVEIAEEVEVEAAAGLAAPAEPDAATAVAGAAWTEPAPAPLDLGEPGSEPAPGWLLVPAEGDLQPAEAVPSDAWFDATTEPLPALPLAFGDYDADGRGVPAGLAAMMVEPLPESPALSADAGELVGDGSATPYQPAPPAVSFGEYDETAPGSAAAIGLAAASLPFDPAAASAIEPGELPEGYDAGRPALDPDALPPPPPGGYDEAAFPADAAYGGPEGDSLPGGTPLELGEPVQDWLPEQALEQGFQLASNGSFGEVDRPVLTPVPGWASVEEVAAATAAAAPATAWESPPALDLAAPFDLSQPAALPEEPVEPLGEMPVEPLGARPADELPTLAAEDILEELPAASEPPPEQAGYAPEPAPAPAYLPEPLGAAADAEALAAAAASAVEAPSQGGIPPEIAAAFGDAPAGVPAASPLFSEPPPAAGPAFGAGEPEPILEAAPPPVPEPYLEPEPLPGPEAAPQVWIAGSHRVVLHTVDGQVKRGLLVDAALDAPELALRPQGPGAPEVVGVDNVKAIFFMLAPGEKAAAPVGKKVRVTFRDGRQVAGYSPDYVEGTIGFFMIPADTRTNTGRIWVYQSAVRQVAVS